MFGLVADLLSFPVAVFAFRLSFVGIATVIGMRIAPLTRAVSSNLPVFGGVCQFLFAVFLFALPLTCGGAANQLRGLKLRCLETLPAIPTTPFVHIARCLTNTRI
jgi:hypothetical protein